MNARDALAALRKLGVPAIDTADAAAAFGLSTAAASQTLTRLAQAGLILSVRHGTWWLEDTLDLLRLPEYLTAPLPSYVSLQTALHRRGLIEQIPEVVYAVSLARTQRVNTKVGSFSIHHVAPRYSVVTTRPSGARRSPPPRRHFSTSLTCQAVAHAYSPACRSSSCRAGSGAKSWRAGSQRSRRSGAARSPSRSSTCCSRRLAHRFAHARPVRAGSAPHEATPPGRALVTTTGSGDS
jgi:hypothetical protein